MHVASIVHRTLAAGLLAVCAAVPGSAQARPDFSGEWVLNRQDSTLPPPVSSVERGVVRIDRREPSFTFHRTCVIGGAPREARFTRATDGREVTETEQGRSLQGSHDAVWIYDRR